jgi:hypothetical protein
VDAEDFEAEEFGIPESVGLSFLGFDFVVGAFQRPRGDEKSRDTIPVIETLGGFG